MRFLIWDWLQLRERLDDASHFWTGSTKGTNVGFGFGLQLFGFGLVALGEPGLIAVDSQALLRGKPPEEEGLSGWEKRDEVKL